MWKQDFWPFGGSRAEKLPWVYVGQIDPPSPGNVIPDLSRNRVKIDKDWGKNRKISGNILTKYVAKDLTKFEATLKLKAAYFQDWQNLRQK